MNSMTASNIGFAIGIFFEKRKSHGIHIFYWQRRQWFKTLSLQMQIMIKRFNVNGYEH